MMVRVLFILLLASPAWAAPTEGRSEKVLQDIDFTPPAGGRLPLDAQFRNESGKTVPLSTYFQGKPVVIAPVYYECPMLCTLTLNGFLKAARALKLSAGKDFDVVAVSINPRDTAALATKKRKVYLQGYNRPGSREAWHFLTGNESEIRRLTEAMGFKYVYDPASEQYAHASGLVVATPDGRIGRGLYGPEFSARDLQLAVIESSQGRISSPLEKILLYCYAFDGSTGRYSMKIMNVVRVSGAASAVALASMVGVFYWRERRRAGSRG